MVLTDNNSGRNHGYADTVKLYSAAQVRELDRVAIEDYGIPGKELMQIAGEAAFSHIMSSSDSIEPLIVLCGPGNNGGDGYVVAECARSIGLDVAVVRSAAPATQDAQLMCERFVRNGGRVSGFPGELPATPGLIVDALLGTGLSRAPDGGLADLIEHANQATCPVVALDMPSGLDSDTGQAFDPCIAAVMTINFIGRKFGCFTAAGIDQCGSLEYTTLNVPDSVFDEVEATARIIPRPQLPPRPGNSHKRQFGDIVVVGGDTGMLGATLLSGRAALKCGAGLVTVASCAEHMDLPALQCPELMSACMENGDRFEGLLEGCDIVVLGPGLGQSAWSEAIFAKAMMFTGPMVIDADGLNLLARSPSSRDNWILTPHPGEAATLLGCTAGDVQKDRLDAVNAMVDRYGGVCILKGAGTLVSGGQGPVWLCDRGNPGMASAGMGDVLSGMTGALLGLGMDITEAAKAGTWLHSMAADELSCTQYPGSLMASDIIDYLPGLLVSS
jgi:NAD(P)H-hydrate epimerase